MEEFDDADVGRLPDCLRDPAGMIRRRKGSMLLTLLALLAATMVFLALKEPYYLAKATILVSTRQIPESFVQSTVQEDSLQRVNAMLGGVLSREKLAGLIRKHDLYPDLAGTHTMAEIVQLARSNIAVGTEEGVGPRQKRQPTRLFSISFRHTDPKRAAAMANDLAGLFTDESVRSRTQQAQLTTDFLSSELDRSEKALRAQNAVVAEFKHAHQGELPSDLPANLARLDRLHKQLQTISLQISQTETQMAMWSSNEDPTSPAARLAALRAQLQGALGVWTEDHPEVASLRRQLSAVQAEVDEEMAAGTGIDRTKMFASAQDRLASLRAQHAETARLIAEVDARIARTPERADEIAALEERESVLRETYLEFIRKVQEAQLAENLESAQQGERFSVVDRAEPPTQPEKDRLKYLIAGLVAALVGSFAVGAFFEAIDPVIVSPRQLVSNCGIPLLGSVPHVT